MKAAQAALLPAVLAVLASGCGTVLNFASGDPDVYGGVQRDIQVVFTPDSVAFTPNTVPSSDAMAGVVVVALVAADIGLSAICDTLTLPLTIYLRQNEKTPNVSDLAPPKQAETAPAASLGRPWSSSAPPPDNAWSVIPALPGIGAKMSPRQQP